jgi:sugar O-acyltransferase (sialic acid O-acetyltransferase NeuD family)
VCGKMEQKKLILVGGGGHCKSVIEVAESVGYNILGILDNPSELGKQVLNYKVIGVDEDMYKYVNDAEFVVTVGQIKNAGLRIKLHKMILEAGGKLATLIASTAHVSKYAKVGYGTVVMHHAFVNADSLIGMGCIINSFANIEHDVVIGDFSHISTGAMVNGNCKIGKETFLGSQSVIVNGVEITDGCVIGAGSLVSKSLNIRGIYLGNPAKFIITL